MHDIAGTSRPTMPFRCRTSTDVMGTEQAMMVELLAAQDVQVVWREKNRIEGLLAIDCSRGGATTTPETAMEAGAMCSTPQCSVASNLRP